MYEQNLNYIPSFRLVRRCSKGLTLDIGCGIGYLSRLFDDYVGIERELRALKVAKKCSTVPFVLGTVRALPFRDNAFKTALLYDVIEHLDLEEAIHEVKRVAEKTVVSLADFNSYYRFLVYDPTHMSKQTIDRILPTLRRSYKNVIVHKTSGIFRLPRILNNFLAKQFPNQLVIECYDGMERVQGERLVKVPLPLVAV